MGTVRVGFELDDTRAIAVAVDDRVQATASSLARGDLAAVAAAVAREVLKGGAMPSEVGVASFTPDAPTVLAAAAALARGAGGVAPRIVASGTAAAVAEAWIGAAAGVQDVVLLAVGDHATAGIVRRGAPVIGARGRAALVAWMSLNPVEREDYRKSGCLEAEVAAVGIVRRLIWRIKAGDRSRVQDQVNGDLSAITAAHVLDAARGNDGVAISVVRDTAKYLGMAAANLVAIADPEALVLGGIIASAADLFLEPVRTEIARRLPRAMFDPLTIVPATLGAEAAAIGAARLAATGR